MDNSAYPYAEAGLRGARREARGEEGSTRSHKAKATTAGGRRKRRPAASIGARRAARPPPSARAILLGISRDVGVQLGILHPAARPVALGCAAAESAPGAREPKFGELPPAHLG